MRRLIAAAMGLGLFAAGCGASTASTGSAGASGECTLEVSTTSTGGIVWGTVHVQDGSHSVTINAQNKKVSLPCNSQATLTQTPYDAGAWPFGGWVTGGATTKSGTLKVQVKGTTKVTAKYVLVGNSSSSGSSSSGSSSGGY